MTKISQYSTDVNITGNDKWIGSDAQNFLITKNFTPNNLANYFNGSNVIDIGTSIRYRYQTLLPGEAREQGTISFETEIGPQVNFSAITTFLIAKNTLKGNTVTQYLDFLVDGKVLLSKASNINIFGYYKIISIEPWIPNTNFFVVEVDFLSGNGFIYEDLDYLVSLVDKVQDIPPPVWGSITGDIEDQTDLIDYISSQITTPTLQEVLDNNHDLVDGNNFQGTEAGLNNTGVNVVAFGTNSAVNNTGDGVNAIGTLAASDNTGLEINAFGEGSAGGNTGSHLNAFGVAALQNNEANHANAFGAGAGNTNIFKNVNLFGFQATADAENQTVFSKWISGFTKYLGRLSFNNITEDRKWELPDADGTIALTSDITTPTLQEVLAEGNTTGGENIVINDADAIQLENSSTLKKGTYDFGADGGISRICGVGFEDMWQSGIRHVFDSNGLIRNSTNCFDIIPDETFDDTLRFKIDSLWTLDNGTSYVCIDATTGAAEWELVSQIPSLQSVLDFDHYLINGNNFQGNLAGGGNTGSNVNAFGSTAALSNSGADINVFGFGSLMVNSGNNVNAFGAQIGGGNVYDSVNLFGRSANADGNNQLVLSKGSYFEPNFMARLSFNDITEDRKYELPDASGTIALTSDIPSGGVTSVGLTMPSAFNVTNSPITSSGDIAVTAVGNASQYIRGDGQLATLPSNASGGSAVSYYLNGGTAASVATYFQMSKIAVIGTGVDFSLAGNGLISQWLTDVADPNRLEIPAGNWNFEMYMSASSSGGTPAFYVELLKYDGVTFTTIANSSAVPEAITSGTLIDLYLTSLAIPYTALTITDRLAVRVYIVNSTGGRTITMHTQDSHLCQIITNFAGGIAALNGLSANTQYFDVGTGATNFNISSSGDTHTFNLLFNIRRNANNSSNNNINYNGYAVTGSAESSAVWTITRLTIAASGSITVATATNVAWTNRESATYI